MISIIVCSIDEYWFDNFSKSVDKTIGVSYEIIRIDNRKENLSISKAYNNGAKLAKYNYLVFVHEDVVFHTENWGLILLKYFGSLENLGIIGVAGSSYHPISPSDWWISDNRYRHFHYVSNDKIANSDKGVLRQNENSQVFRVFCIDGMFLALDKKVFFEFGFDEKIKGFHGYDTSISLRVARKYYNYFVPNLLIEHFSSGNHNSAFWLNTIHSIKSVYKELPYSINNKIDISVELKSWKIFIKNSIKFKYNIFLLIKEGLSCLFRVCLKYWGYGKRSGLGF